MPMQKKQLLLAGSHLRNWRYFSIIFARSEKFLTAVTVKNENDSVAINTLGTDEYMVVYKYANFFEEIFAKCVFFYVFNEKYM